jgi:hyperosmotically inducible periplasmic protein
MLKSRSAMGLLAATLLLSPYYAANARAQGGNGQQETRANQNLVREVRHQLLLLPYYSVFDNLAFRVDGDRVTLEGQVVRPTLKSDAQAAVKSIEGVSEVTNNIEVLPTSGMDDQLRRALYRAIYGDATLNKYSWSSVASIHIIVKNGHVTLEGVVDNDSDKNVAEIRAKSVPNVFSVTNNLRVGSDNRK